VWMSTGCPTLFRQSTVQVDAARASKARRRSRNLRTAPSVRRLSLATDGIARPCSYLAYELSDLASRFRATCSSVRQWIARCLRRSSATSSGWLSELISK